MQHLFEIDRHRALGLLQAGLLISEVYLQMNVNRTTILRLRQRLDTRRIHVIDTNVRYGPRNMPRGMGSNGEVSYSVTNLGSALTIMMALFVYGEEVVKDNKQIALGNTTGGVEHL
ncbi:hypothetical protein ElyMa_002871600 [Elysia marginata]|uniref:Uncharacterized protein n=1 Tax=Elysia marginata TaxID=1093978 RepID=A0AAV4HZP9_9GAST|nr:hypothetical protein ElyMa_002871600 [Elysia marginata]